MHKALVPLLMCPICQGELESQIIRQDEKHLIEGELVCKNCKRRYPVVDGIGIFLDGIERKDDFWKKLEDFATRFRKGHPILFFFLTKTSLLNIKPEYHFLKGLLLEDEKTLERATRRIYTKDYLTGYEKTKQALREVEIHNPPIILDIACGRGGFFKQFLRSRQHRGIYVATDFSLTVLRSNQRWLRKNGLDEQATLLAFDATIMPFKDNSIPAAVSNLGFLNIRNGGRAVNEAYRVLTPQGVLLANFMFPTEKTENYTKAKELGYDQFYIKESTVEVFKKSGFKFTLDELHRGLVRPTPGGIDVLPMVPDTYSFCAIRATKPAQ